MCCLNFCIALVAKNNYLFNAFEILLFLSIGKMTNKINPGHEKSNNRFALVQSSATAPM